MRYAVFAAAMVLVHANLVAAVPCNGGTAPVCTYIDYQQFSQFSGTLSVIDFETMPNGMPSVPGTFLSPAFNYGSQGAVFSSPNVAPQLISGQGAFALAVNTFLPFVPTKIIIDLSIPSPAIGVAFPGGTTLSAYDLGGNVLGSVSFSGVGTGFFLGITSDVPIARVIADSGTQSETIEAFFFNPIPEPATLGLAIPAIIAALARKSKR
ncbi:MAG: hypothetical protein U1A27_01720 [Phycisphaerae bacterium]